MTSKKGDTIESARAVLVIIFFCMYRHPVPTCSTLAFYQQWTVLCRNGAHEVMETKLNILKGIIWPTCSVMGLVCCIPGWIL